MTTIITRMMTTMMMTMIKETPVGAGHRPARHCAAQNAFAVRRKTIVSLRENRKSVICGGRADVPPLQVLLEMGFFDKLTPRENSRGVGAIYRI